MAQQPEKPAAAAAQVAGRKTLRALGYYAALFLCVATVLAVSYSAVLSFARGSASGGDLNAETVAEIQTLRGFLGDLNTINEQFSGFAEAGRRDPTNAARVRLNEVRRLMGAYPNESQALSTLIAAGDALRAWAGDLKNASLENRADQSLRVAETATMDRVRQLDPHRRLAR